MKVSECMTRDVKVAAPGDSLRTAAIAMAEHDTGFLPIGENDRLLGVITDRDIAIRAVGTGASPDSSVEQAMSSDVRYCYDDDDVDAVLKTMGEQQIRRMPVVDRDKRLVGVISLGDAATDATATKAGQALSDISRKSEQHSQEV